MKISERDMREAIGSELADILHRQKTIVRCNEKLHLLDDDKVKDEFRTMAEEDENNLRLLETVISKYGIRMEPKGAVIRIADTLSDILGDSAALPLEKLGAYTLLKQNQLMSSHLLHKSVLEAAADIKLALALFDEVNACFSRHVSDLTTLMEASALEWFTGKEPDVGLFSRARDAVSTLASMVMGKMAKPADEMSVLKNLKMDHRKTEILFQEIQGTEDQKQAIDLFHQLKADLTSHSLAEEETVYAYFQKSPTLQQLMQDSQQDHEDIRSLLDEVSDVLDDRNKFLDKLEDLHALVSLHVQREEDEAFALIEKISTEDELRLLSESFLQEKKKIQKNVGVDEIIASAASEDLDSRTSPPSAS